MKPRHSFSGSRETHTPSRTAIRRRHPVANRIARGCERLQRPDGRHGDDLLPPGSRQPQPAHAWIVLEASKFFISNSASVALNLV
jgi:hypothetical protein